MSLNTDNVYELSKEVENRIKLYLSKFLSSNRERRIEKYYKKILELLFDIEDEFIQKYEIDNLNLTYEESRDNMELDLKQFAFPQIREKLLEFKNKHHSNHKNEGWEKREIKIDGVIDKIWKVWRCERENRPRAGIILYYVGPNNSIEILLVWYMKNDEIQYGFPKGKIEEGERVLDCAIREPAEEIGIDPNWISEQISNNEFIKKNIKHSTIEHYYYIIRVPDKDISLNPNLDEIRGVKWHNIYTVKCCNHCLGEQLIQPTVKPTRSSYFMVNCTDRYNNISLIQDILQDIDGNNIFLQKYENIHRSCHR